MKRFAAWACAPLVAAMSAVPTESNAAVTHLDCMMTNGTKEILWNVTLNEEAAEVDYIIPSMNVTQKRPAIFTADKVVFSGMSISRTDLSFVRDAILPGGTSDRGQCKLASVPKRQF